MPRATVTVHHPEEVSIRRPEWARRVPEECYGPNQAIYIVWLPCNISITHPPLCDPVWLGFLKLATWSLTGLFTPTLGSFLSAICPCSWVLSLYKQSVSGTMSNLNYVLDLESLPQMSPLPSLTRMTSTLPCQISSREEWCPRVNPNLEHSFGPWDLKSFSGAAPPSCPFPTFSLLQ